MNIEPSIIKISPKNINLEEKNPDELYNQFKILEKTLKTTIETSNDKNIMSFNDKLDEKFEEITKIANILLIKEIKFSNEKSLDRRIWHLFKLYIDRRLRTKSLEDFMEENSECLDKKINYVNNLLKQLIEVKLLNV